MRKPKAYCLVRNRPAYRREAFVEGLTQLGYTVEFGLASTPARGDLLVIWNRYGTGAAAATMFEKLDAPVIVAENGYLPFKGSRKTFALARSYHNGVGRWPMSDDRPDLDVELQDWREPPSHGYALLLPQRGIGPRGVAMPLTWIGDVTKRLAKVGVRNVKVRRHPGNVEPMPMDEDLRDARFCVTWASGAGIKAICAGVPVFHELKGWIGAPASVHGLADLARPFQGDRRPMLDRLAAAQCTVEELATGMPIARLVALEHGLVT